MTHEDLTDNESFYRPKVPLKEMVNYNKAINQFRATVRITSNEYRQTFSPNSPNMILSNQFNASGNSANLTALCSAIKIRQPVFEEIKELDSPAKVYKTPRISGRFMELIK